ncbi:unnamed protein product [Alternaria burnsii]|nr:unnamed protein product [Alternaria burnsii]
MESRKKTVGTRASARGKCGPPALADCDISLASSWTMAEQQNGLEPRRVINLRGLFFLSQAFFLTVSTSLQSRPISCRLHRRIRDSMICNQLYLASNFE